MGRWLLSPILSSTVFMHCFLTPSVAMAKSGWLVVFHALERQDGLSSGELISTRLLSSIESSMFRLYHSCLHIPSWAIAHQSLPQLTVCSPVQGFCVALVFFLSLEGDSSLPPSYALHHRETAPPQGTLGSRSGSQIV